MEKFNYHKFVCLRSKYEKFVNIIATIRIIIFMLAIIFLCFGNKNIIFTFFGIFFCFIFFILVLIHNRFYNLLDYYRKYVNILNQYEDRLNGNWKKFEDNGIDYNDDLLKDLDIVGDNSLFQFLNVCKTLGGRNKLIDKLSNRKVSKEEIVNNQRAIKELVKNVDFDIDFLVNLSYLSNKKINLESNFKYLDTSIGRRFIDLIFATIFSFVSLFLFFLSFFKIISFNFFYGMFIFNFLINYMYSYIYKYEFESINKVSNDYNKLYRVYKCILKNHFNCSKLKKIYKDIESSNDSINKLVFINDLNNLKNNILSSFIFNGLFCINIIVMFMYSRFQDKNIDSLKRGIVDIEELEAMISLAGIGLIKTNVCMPVVDNKVKISFSNIMHPLLHESKCVGNDFNCGNSVNIITGSNMGGKTSFLRTIGINLILMNAGTYVCADNFSSCYFKIFTSMRVCDDINKGISTFYGELLRIKNAMDYEDGNRLILVDEIFKGTNYQDRIYGAINVIKKLNDQKTVLFITTHDFELCDIKIKNLYNYYVKEYYDGDNICFDYKIRRGKCESTNAKYLMKKLNIVD